MRPRDKTSMALRLPLPAVTNVELAVELVGGLEVEVEVGGFVIVPELVEPVLSPVWHPPLGTVSVTVTVNEKLTVVVAAQDVTAVPGHSLFVSVTEVEMSVTVLVVSVTVVVVSVTVVVLVDEMTDVVVVAVRDEAVVNPPETPHSSRLWPSSQHHTRPPNSFQAQ